MPALLPQGLEVEDALVGERRRPAIGPSEATGHVLDWLVTVELQRSRILDDPDADAWRQEIDARLFMVAVRNLVRAVRLYRDQLAGDGKAKATAALATFDATLPGAKDLRDVVEHLDAYATGRGNLQSKARELMETRTGVEVAKELHDLDRTTSRARCRT